MDSGREPLTAGRIGFVAGTVYAGALNGSASTIGGCVVSHDLRCYREYTYQKERKA